MADNSERTPGSGESIASKEIGGVKHQLVLLEHGEGTTATRVSSADPLPVTDDAAQTALAALLGALGGTLDVNDADTQAALATVISHVDGLEGKDFATQTTLAAIQGLLGGTLATAGSVAHDSPDSGNPVKVGGKSRTALVAVSATSDRTDLALDKLGRTFAVAAPLDQAVSGTLNRTNTTAANIIGAPGASVAIVVTDVLVVNAHATVGTKVRIRDGTTDKLIGYAGPVGGGFSLSNGDGLFVATANAAITGICDTTAADVDIFVSGYKIPA
jgi:hypothetical protein